MHVGWFRMLAQKKIVASTRIDIAGVHVYETKEHKETEEWTRKWVQNIELKKIEERSLYSTGSIIKIVCLLCCDSRSMMALLI